MGQYKFSNNSNISLLLTQCGVFTIFLQQSGMAMRDAVYFSSWVTAQILVGVVVLLVLLPVLECSLEMQIGIGFVIGSVVTLTVAYLYKIVPWWAVLSMFLALLLNRKCRKAIWIWSGKAERSFVQLCIINLILVTFFAGFRTELYVVSVFLFAHVLSTKFSQQKMAKWHNVLVNKFAYLGFLTIALITASQFAATQVYGAKFLRPLYEGTDDLVFSEAMSNSIVTHGIASNVAAFGSAIKYYWYSFAWVGSLTELLNLKQFAVTLHALPLVCVFITILLVVALSKLVGPSDYAALLSVCLLLFANSMFDNLPFYYSFNTSNLFAVPVLLCTVLIFVNVLDAPNFKILVLFFLLSVILILSKTPYMAVFLSGMVFCVIMLRKKQTKSKNHLLIAMCAISCAICIFCYLVFLYSSWFNASYIIGPSFAIGGKFSIIYSILAILLFICSRFCIMQSLWIRNVAMSQVTAVLCIGVSIAGLSRFIVDGRSSENHLLVAGFTLSAPLIAHTLLHLQGSLKKDRRVLFYVYACSFSLSAALLINIFALIQHHQVSASRSRFLQFAHPSLSVIAAALVCMIFIRTEVKKVLKFALVMGFAMSSFAAYLSNSNILVHRNLGEQVASLSEVEMFVWVDMNTSRDAIFATNRYLCRSELGCDHDDSSQLLAALSRRDVFIEGPRFISGGHPYASWISTRVALSIGFADDPSFENSQRLKSFGIKYFLLDERFTDTKCSELPKKIKNVGPLCVLKL